MHFCRSPDFIAANQADRADNIIEGGDYDLGDQTCIERRMYSLGKSLCI